MKGAKDPSDSLAWLGGADLEVLSAAPRSEHTRFVQMAIVLMTTSGIGAVSMMFALHHGVGTSLTVGVIGGLVWGFIILNLDRFLVLSMGHTRHRTRLLLMALPRVALAAVISLVVATPMTLWIFANDIQNEMVQLNATESKQVAKEQQQSGPATQAAAILAHINRDKAILAGHMQGTTSSPQMTFWQGKVAALTPQAQTARVAMDKAQAKYQCEVDGSGPGCAGASKLPGFGPIAKEKQQEFDQVKQNYENLTSQLQAAKKQLAKAQVANEKTSGQTLRQQQAQARSELTGLENSYNTLEARLKKNETAAQNAVEGNTGILAQLQDLSTVGRKNPTLRIAQIFVTLLFFCIEILPVIVKVLLNMGPLSTYETLLKNEEDSIIDDAKLKRVIRRRNAQGEADKQIAVDEHMRQLEEDLGKKANEHVAEHMEAILDVTLAEWSTQVQAQLGVQVPSSATHATNGQGQTGSNGGHGGGGHTFVPSQRQNSGNRLPPISVNGSSSPPVVTIGSNGSNGSNGGSQTPTVTNLTSLNGYSLPDADDEDLL
jgi:hypothetical protein